MRPSSAVVVMLMLATAPAAAQTAPNTKLLRVSFDGLVVAEVSTRKSEDRAEREADLAEALAFTRLHLAAPAATDRTAWQR